MLQCVRSQRVRHDLVTQQNNRFESSASIRWRWDASGFPQDAPFGSYCQCLAYRHPPQPSQLCALWHDFQWHTRNSFLWPSELAQPAYSTLEIYWRINISSLDPGREFGLAPGRGLGWGGGGGARRHEWRHVYVWQSLFAVHLKLSQHC